MVNETIYSGVRKRYNEPVMAGNKKRKDAHAPVTIVNRQARHEYEITDTFEAGLVLTGTEVKSLRLGKGNLADGYCRINNGEIWLQNMHISPYEQGNIYNVEPVRPRKLLLHKWQITQIVTKMQVKGLTVIPTKLYFSKGRAKVEVGIGRGRKLWDKREHIADRDREREMRRELSERD